MVDQAMAEEPVFDEPWQAEAFAVTVALNEAGHLDWTDWADYLSAALKEAGLDASAPLQPRHDQQGNRVYYQAWLVALERVVRDRDWVGPLQLGARREAIRAYNRVADTSSIFSVDQSADSDASVASVSSNVRSRK